MIGSFSGIWTPRKRLQGLSLTLDPIAGSYRAGSVEAASLYDLVTFARAGSAYDFDSTGLLTEVVAATVRSGQTRVNEIRNPRAEGSTVGAIGSGGVAPTNWTLTVPGGLTEQVVGTGTEAGIPYVDVRLSGTATAAAQRWTVETSTAIAAALGQVWTVSAYFRLVAGSLTNIVSLNWECREFASGASSGGLSSVLVTPTDTLTRFSHTRTLTDATCNAIQPGLRVQVAAGAVDMTLRIGGVQAEKAASASALTLPPAGTPRVSYRHNAVSAPGFLLESAASNLVTNPWAVGGGTTVPTSWGPTGIDAGITVSYPGQTTINGIPCQLVRFAGTMASTLVGRMQFHTGTLPVTAAAGIVASAYVQLAAGSLANITAVQLRVTSGTTTTVTFTPTATLTRYSGAFSFATDTTSVFQVNLTATAGQAVDITLAIGLPNFHDGQVLTSPMAPAAGTTGANSRVADSLAIIGSPFAAALGTGQRGTIIMDVNIPTAPAVGIASAFAELSDGTTANRLALRHSTASVNVLAQPTVATVNGTATATSAISYGTTQRLGLRWSIPDGTYATCVNGGTIRSAAGTLPASFSQLRLGCAVGNYIPLQGRLRLARLYKTALSDAQFQALTTLGA